MRSTLLLLVTMAVTSACTESPTQPIDSIPLFAMAGGRVIGSVTGSGHAPCAPIDSPNDFRCDVSNPDGGLRTFSFNARLRADGSVGGRFQVNNRENGTQGQGDIVCMRFTRDNRAWIIGVVTNVQGPGNVGDLTAFAVEDNGEGSGSDADRISNLFRPVGALMVAALVCGEAENDDAFNSALNDAFDGRFGFEIANGNVQVRAPTTG